MHASSDLRAEPCEPSRTCQRCHATSFNATLDVSKCHEVTSALFGVHLTSLTHLCGVVLSTRTPDNVTGRSVYGTAYSCILTTVADYCTNSCTVRQGMVMVWFGLEQQDPGTPDKSPLPATVTTLSHAASLWLIPAHVGGDLLEYAALLTAGRLLCCVDHISMRSAIRHARLPA